MLQVRRQVFWRPRIRPLTPAPTAAPADLSPDLRRPFAAAAASRQPPVKIITGGGLAR
jgi:hypothetical protein